MLTAQTRVTIPRRQPKTLRRVRLLDNLHNNVHRKVNFVCAPAGYGKTTLLVDFAEDVDAAIFWYRISTDDQSLPAFVENLVYAFRQRYKNFGEQLLEAIEAENISTGSIAYTLAQEIETAIEDFSLLVLDDYHIVSNQPEIVDLIESFLQIMPDRLRLLIGSRNVYGIPTAYLYVQEQLNIITENDLKFQPEEIVDLCRKYYKIKLTPEQSEQITSQSEGWIVAILLSLRSKNLALDIPKIVGAKEHVYAYLADDVISSLPAELLNFMHATSLVDEFTIPLANHILGIPNAGEIIQKLDELNLFLSRTDSEDKATYRYHQLFSDFLRGHFEKKNHAGITEQHTKIAAWYKNEGQFSKAISHYFSASKGQAAAELIDQIAHQLYTSGQAQLLQEWYAALSTSQAILTKTPNLLLNLAKHQIAQGNFEEVTHMLDTAEDAFRQREDHDNIVNLLVSRGMYLRFTGQTEQARQIADEVQQYADQYQLDRYYWHQAERLKGITTYFLGDAANALTYLKNAAAFFRQSLAAAFNSRQAHELVMTLADIGYIALSIGNIFEAQKSYQEALNLARRVRGNADDFSNASNNYAYLNYLLGNYQEAWTHYLQALDTAKISGLNRTLGYIYNGQADLLCDIEEWDQARDTYLKAQEIAEKTNETGALADTFHGLMEVETHFGLYNQAMYYLREKARITQSDIHEPAYLAKFAKIYLLMGQPDLAEKNIRQSVDALPNSPTPTQELGELYFIAALTMHTTQKADKAASFLKQALEISALLGYDQFLVTAFRQHTKEVKKILANLPASPQVTSILKRAGQPLPSMDELVTPAAETSEEQNSLNVTAFDQGSVRLNGEIIPVKAWGSVGARALFYFILDRKEAAKEEIALEFWPEFSPAKVNSNFHATLWRVRNALSSRQILTFENERYQINPAVNYYFDLDEFNTLYAGLNDPQTPLEKRTAMRRMVEIYKNDYLEDIDMLWADERRRELQTRFLSVLTQLANLEFDKKNYQAALDHYLHTAHLDYYQDDLHLKIMQTMAAMGSPHKALQHYQKYAKKLKVELHLEPADDLKKLAQNLSS